MTRLLDLDRLEGRLQSIMDEASSLRSRVEELDREADRLRLVLDAAAPFIEIDGSVKAEKATEESMDSQASEATIRNTNGHFSWSNGEAPTFPEMFDAIIRDAKANGRPGAKSGEILETIRHKWRADVRSDHVRPRLWRLVEKGRLVKHGQYYDIGSGA